MDLISVGEPVLRNFRSMAFQAPSDVAAAARAIFPRLGLSQKSVNPGVFSGEWDGRGRIIAVRSPIDGSVLGRVRQASVADYERAVNSAETAFKSWRDVPP